MLKLSSFDLHRNYHLSTIYIYIHTRNIDVRFARARSSRYHHASHSAQPFPLRSIWWMALVNSFVGHTSIGRSGRGGPMRQGEIAHHDRIFPGHEVVAVNPSQPSFLPRAVRGRFTLHERERRQIRRVQFVFGLIRRIETVIDDREIGSTER